jgi:hypothetical protein
MLATALLIFTSHPGASIVPSSLLFSFIVQCCYSFIRICNGDTWQRLAPSYTVFCRQRNRKANLPAMGRWDLPRGVTVSSGGVRASKPTKQTKSSLTERQTKWLVK